MSLDLKSARIYYSVLGDEAKREEAGKALSRARGFIRRQLGPRLDLKSIPELRFIYDDTLDRGMRIESLLDGKPDGPPKES